MSRDIPMDPATIASDIKSELRREMQDLEDEYRSIVREYHEAYLLHQATMMDDSDPDSGLETPTTKNLEALRAGLRGKRAEIERRRAWIKQVEALVHKLQNDSAFMDEIQSHLKKYPPTVE